MTSENRNRYVLMQEVADCATRHNGVVFGGFVRDFILHEHAAKQFHAEFDSKNYDDVSVAPHLKDRLLVPSDIDVRFETREDYMGFKTDLEKNRCFKISRRGRCEYGVFTLHLSLEIEFKKSQVATASRKLIENAFRDVVKLIPGGQFSVDVVVGNVTLNNGLDFECNGLIMDSMGINLGPYLAQDLSPIGMYRRLEEVKGDILKKIAIAVNITQKRWEKMEKKDGWDIIGRCIEKVKPLEKEECIICHGEDPTYKLECCNARYHKECLKMTLEHNNTRCAHCRNEFCEKSEFIKVFELD